MIQEYEYASVKIALPTFFISKKRLQEAERQRNEAIEEYAHHGWRLVQIIQPFQAESSLRSYYEIIFEREKDICMNIDLNTFI